MGEWRYKLCKGHKRREHNREWIIIVCEERKKNYIINKLTKDCETDSENYIVLLKEMEDLKKLKDYSNIKMVE